MAFPNCKNVWGKCNRNSVNHGQQGTFKVEDQRNSQEGQQRNLNDGSLTDGPFGSTFVSGQSFGARTLPTVGSNKKHSQIYNFELESCSSGSSCSSSAPSSGPSSIIGFGMEPKRYNWGLNGMSMTEKLMGVASGGSSRSSGCYRSK